MALFRKTNKGIAPHIGYPEIMHWQAGDEIVARNIHAKNPLQKLVAYEDGVLNITYIFKSVTADGFILVEEKESGEPHKADFYTFVKKAKNITLKKRLMSSELNDSNEYMELMSEFQKAFDELQSADNHPKRLGSESGS